MIFCITFTIKTTWQNNFNQIKLKQSYFDVPKLNDQQKTTKDV